LILGLSTHFVAVVIEVEVGQMGGYGLLVVVRWFSLHVEEDIGPPVGGRRHRQGGLSTGHQEIGAVRWKKGCRADVNSLKV
jgi:hypothetical protein